MLYPLGGELRSDSQQSQLDRARRSGYNMQTDEGAANFLGKGTNDSLQGRPARLQCPCSEKADAGGNSQRQVGGVLDITSPIEFFLDAITNLLCCSRKVFLFSG